MSTELTTVSVDEQWEATVETLQKFYSVIIAIALTSSLAKLIASLEGSSSYLTDISLAALSIAMLSTIVPFYHGMERHLYITHILQPALGEGGKPIPLLVDILAFIAEGGILFAMGRKIDEAVVFLQLWTALLITDIIWTLIVWRVQRGESPLWARNNFIWLCIAWAVWFGLPWVLTKVGASLPSQVPILGCLIALIEVGRSVTDYRVNWAFYFPDSHRRG